MAYDQTPNAEAANATLIGDPEAVAAASCAYRSDVAAYIDSELDDGAAESFERHAAACAACRASLSEQRALLATLDGAFGASRKLMLPEEFARTIAVRARADLSGVRAGVERKRAVSFCLLLALATTALLGAAAGAGVSESFGAAWRALSGVAGVANRLAGDFVSGVIALARVLGGAETDSGVAPLALLCCVFVGALLLLLRLVGMHRREHRP